MKRSLRAAVVLAVLSTACKDAGPPTSLVTVLKPGIIPVYAGGPSSKDFRPTGKGLDVADDTNPPPRTRSRIEYHNGAVLYLASIVYVIWYGDWSSKLPDQLLLTDFLINLGDRPYFEISRLYPNGAGQAPSGSLTFGGSGADAYSDGNSADKCAWTYTTTYLAANGKPANVHLGQRDYLLQQLWVPSKNGGAFGLTG